MSAPPHQADGAADRKIPQAACDREIPATECLSWHIAGPIPGAKMSDSGRSCRLLCPNHADLKPSLTISVGKDAPLIWHCHVCGKGKQLEVRAALISVYKLSPKCLPMTRQERAETEEMVIAALESSYAPSTRLICIRAILDGMRGPLPPAPALVSLGERAGVSERSAHRARKETAGASLDHLFVPKISEPVKDPKVAPAVRGSSSPPNWQSPPDWQRGQRQIGSRTPRKPAA